MITRTQIRILNTSNSSFPKSNNDSSFTWIIESNSTIITFIWVFNSEGGISVQYELVHTLYKLFNSEDQLVDFVVNSLSDLNSGILRSFSLNPDAVL